MDKATKEMEAKATELAIEAGKKALEVSAKVAVETAKA